MADEFETADRIRSLHRFNTQQIGLVDRSYLGGVYCVRQSDEVAELRLFLLTPDARGLGLGRRLSEACMTFARDRGYRRMVLWTHKSHSAACALYMKYGFQMTSEEPVHEFGVDLVRQNWEIDL